MMKTLGDLINKSLSDADTQLKIASASSAPALDPGDFLERELLSMSPTAPKTAAEECAPETKDKGKDKKASREILDNASYGLKLAQALEAGAAVVQKVANSPLSAPGPAVTASGFENASTVSPKATSTVTDKITGGTTTAGNLPTNINEHTGKTAAERAATESLIRSKEAQADVLRAMGRTEEADKLASEIKKLAQDPSSPQPSMPAHSDSFRLSTEPGESTAIPDNKGLINMTKAQAKDRSVSTVNQHITERPKKDNTVPAHTLRTDGQKISADEAKARIAEAQKVASDPNADPKARVKAAALVNAVKAKVAAANEVPL